MKCLHALIGSPNFDCAYAGLALHALTIADPDTLVEHFALLRGSLQRMFQEFQTDDEAKRILATGILDTVQLSGVVSAWPHLKYLDKQDEAAPLDPSRSKS